MGRRVPVFRRKPDALPERLVPVPRHRRRGQLAPRRARPDRPGRRPERQCVRRDERVVEPRLHPRWRRRDRAGPGARALGVAPERGVSDTPDDAPPIDPNPMERPTMRRISLFAATIAIALGLTIAPVAHARSAGPTIVGAAVAVNAASGEFDHLIAAVQRAGLVDALNGNRQFTVFAPTDAAFESLFAALGVSGVDDVPVTTLRAVLLHHVAPGERLSGDVLGASRIRMLDRSFTRPAVLGGVPTIDGATIVLPDVNVSNGVIHVIDAVLLP